ncbi:MAG: pectinesterase family protein [Paludibacter sp.]
MKKLLHQKFLCALFCLLGLGLYAQAVNTATTITWPFDLGTAGQVAAFSAGTESYFSTNWVNVGTNLTIKDKATHAASGVTFTRFQPLTTGTADAANVVSFNIRPATGLGFRPTSVSFKCMRYGTDGGSIDVVWVSANGTPTTIATALKPNRDNNAAGPSIATYDLSTFTIPESKGDCGLYIYIYALGNTKQIGLSSIALSGNIEGEVVNVTKYTLNSSVSPASSGTITTFPVGTSFDEGTNIRLTANRNFGYQFKEWRNATTDAVVSTANPYEFKLNANTNVKAVFDPINTYAFALTTEGAPSYMVDVTPKGMVVNNQTMYETGTTVTLTASNNNVLTFTNWNGGETNSVKTVSMTQDQNITASFSAKDYVVAWDFYKAGNNSRVADLYSTTDNQTANLVLRKADGTLNGWLDKSIVAATGNYGRGSAVNWKPLADQYYYQISFNAKDFTNMTVKAGMLYSYNAYAKQYCEYSTNGTDFTRLGEINLSAGGAWVDSTFTLPAAADHAATVYVRWIPDYTSALVGTTATANNGTSISNIVVFGTPSIYNNGVAPVLASSIPAALATNASTTGKVVLNFNEKVQVDAQAAALLNGKFIKPNVSGKTLTFAYSGLDYNTEYTFDLGENNVSDYGGNKLTSKINFKFTTMTRPVVTKKMFDFVVGVDGDFKAAIAAATAVSNSGERFRIFFPNGDYNIGANTGDTNQKTTFTLPNVSLVGQSSDNVVLYNQNTSEGIGVTATMYFTSTANNIYVQDLTLRNKDFRSSTTGSFTSMGRCVALQDQGNKNIYKNVKVQSNQDTYYSGSGRLYFENSALHGTVDFLCGGGNVFFNECLLYLEDRGGNCITAPATASNWGYVFSNCIIDGYASTNGNYNLGRPWQNSPRSVYINTKMKVLPTGLGWTEMGVVPGLFAEYNSTTYEGTPIDVSGRKKSFTYNNVTTPVDPYLTAEQAATYTVENVLGGTECMAT